ncbi:MAG TPA: DUF2884 family protein [Solimonas sp.]
MAHNTQWTLAWTLALGLLATSLTTTAVAHDSPMALCDYELAYEVSVSDQDDVHLRAPDEDWHLQGERLHRNDRELSLSATEREQLLHYREDLARLTREVNRVAVDGAMLGIEALTITLATLGNDRDADALGARLARVGGQLQTQLDGRQLPPGRIGDDLVSEAIGEEIAALAGSIALKITGGIASLVVGAIFDPGAAEARSRHIERTVERRIEPRADALARRADAICADLRTLDAQERAIGRFDLLRTSRPAV